MKKLLIVLCFLSLLSCSSDQVVENSSYTGHINDTISLSLYDINLGDSIDCVCKKFPDVYEVCLDRISNYLPLKAELGRVYEEMGISIFAVDTTFVIDHRSTKDSYTSNGVHIDFPYDYTKHQTILTFFIQHGHVLQIELFVGRPSDTKRYGDYFPDYECGRAVLQMYKERYGECDSILFVNKEGNKGITLSVNASEEECEEAQDFVGYDFTKNSLWQWKNAQILIQPRYDNHFFGCDFWTLCRVLYTDIAAVNRESQRVENERINEENRIEREKQMYQDQLEEALSNQDM